MQFAIMGIPATITLYYSEMYGDYTVLISNEFCSIPFFETKEEAEQAARQHYAKELANEN